MSSRHEPRTRPEGRAWPLHWYLVAVVAAAVVPLLLFTTLMLTAQRRMEMQAHRDGMLRTATAMSVAIDREWAAAQAVLDTLAGSMLLDQGDFAAFHTRARDAAGRRPNRYIVLFDVSGQQLLNTARPFGSQLPNPFVDAHDRAPATPQITIGGSVPILQTFRTGQPVTSSLFFSISTEQPVVALYVPVVREEKVLYVLTMVTYAHRFNALLEEADVPPDWSLGLVDGDGRVIARWPHEAAYVGRPGTDDFLRSIRLAQSGFESGRSVADNDVYYAWTRVDGTDWTVGIAAPRAAVDGAADHSLALWGGGALVLTVLGVLAALLASRRIAAPISALSRAAAQVQRGEPVPLNRSAVLEVQHLHHALTVAAQAVQREMREHEQRVAAELEREQAQREARNKDEHLTMLGHELRNPLAAIVNAVRLLPKDASDARSAGLRQVLERQSDYMLRLVHDLLDLSRISRGTIQLQSQPVDLVKKLKVVASDQRAALEEGGCLLDLQLPDEPLWVEGDKVRLAQVFTNLLHNACKFTASGGRITVLAERDDAARSAIVKVRDTGEGMDQQTLERVFEPYVQGAGARGTSVGLGLGLSLVRRLVELHGGTVEAKSDGPGLGSTFQVTLPLTSAPAQEQSPPPPASVPAAGGGHRVLLVEDSPAVASVFAMILRDMGHDVRVASNGFDALNQIEAQTPDVVLSDLSMPKMDGYELARKVRAEPRWDHVVLVAVSGFGQAEDRARSRAAGFSEHLVKPPDLDQLAALFRSLATRSTSTS